jgi:putative ABC transport system permease protein
MPSVGEGEAVKILNDILKEKAPAPLSDQRVMRLSSLSDYYILTNHGAVLKLVISLTVIIAFILILAVTNFINISIAGSFARLREVGIRKVIGSMKRQLVFQFLMESILWSFISGLAALVLYQLLHGYFNSLLNADLPSILEFKLRYWLLITSLAVATGGLAGAYPALFQSGAKPIESLKGKSKSVQGTVNFSRILVTLQFAITLFIFSAAIVLSSQVTFFLEKDLGYNGSQVLIVNSVPRVWDEQGYRRMEGAREEFVRSGKIEAVSLSWGVPAWGIGGFENTTYKTGLTPDSGISASLAGVDENFDDVYQLKLAEGKFFFDEHESWTPGRVVLNESASRGLKVSAGEKITIIGSDTSEFTVAGIIRDFNYESMHEAVAPIILMHFRDFQSYRAFSFRLAGDTPAESIATVEALWKKVFPEEPFNYFFADERLQALYTTEMQMKKASSVATVLMLIIVLTGVLGLVSLNVSKRVKEIGIRKALGATVSEILLMFSREYARLMFVAIVLAIPLAYFFAHTWLENFVYHIPLSWWMFALPAALLMLLIIVIVSARSYGVAATKPVQSLRYE